MSAAATVKDMVRHIITRSGLTGLLMLVHKANGQKADHLKFASLAERFSEIYKTGVWLNGRASGSLSGDGSDLRSTVSIKERLPALLGIFNTNALLDLGCGDFNWMKNIEHTCRYIGADIVPDLINAIHGTETRSFQVLDATVDRLPEADTVLCREVIFHLSFRDISRLIENVRSAGASFLIATTDESIKFNADIPSGDFRNLSLTRAPFLFPARCFRFRTTLFPGIGHSPRGKFRLCLKMRRCSASWKHG
jgi:hypothetical protein